MSAKESPTTPFMDGKSSLAANIPPPPQNPLGLGFAGLKKARQLELFENLDEHATEYKPATAKMRLLDTLRYHRPTAQEQIKYNLPGSVERLCLHKLNDVMSICLARKGRRFTSSHIQSIGNITTELSSAFEIVDVKFKTLSPAVCRYKSLSSDVLNGSEKEVNDSAKEFHDLANTYIQVFTRFKDIVNEIREHTVTARDLFEFQKESETDSEFESKAKSPFPTFLFVLIQKYRRERSDVLMIDPNSSLSSSLPSHPWWPTDSHPPLDSLAQFALFLAAVLVQRLPFLKIDLDGIVVLLQVLKVDHTAIEETLHVEFLGCKPTYYTLCHTIFEFLCTVRELRSIPKRKDLIEASRRQRKKLRREQLPPANTPVT